MSNRTLQSILLILLVAWSASGQGIPGTIQWLQTNQPNYVAQANAVACDKSGNVIVVGQFKNTVDFGTGVITGAGFWDGFIAKYTSSGALTWVKTFGNTGFDTAQAVAIDSQTNIIVAGTFQGSMNLGVGVMTAQSATFNQDAFAAKFNPAGTCIWSTNWGSPAADTAFGVAVDSSDNVIAASSSGGVVNFNNGTLTGHGGTDIGIIKLSSANGTTLWGQLYGSTLNDTPNALAVDNNNNVYVAGIFNSGGGGTGDLGGAALAGSTNDGIFLAKYAGSTGAFTWSRIFGGNGGYGVATDPVNTNVFLTGGFTGFVDFGAGPISGAFGHSGAFFMASYDPSGTYRFAKAYGGNGDITFAVTVNSNATVAMTGQSGGTIDWLGTGITMPGSGYLLANFDTSGVYQWAIRGNQNNSQSFGYGVAFDQSGRVLTTGTFFGTANFGGISATAGLGDNNVFVAQYAKATDYFVDGLNGNDANTGTSWAQAFATLQKAANVVTNGNTVTVTNNHWFKERVTLKSSNVKWIGLGATNWGFSGQQFVDSQNISGFYIHQTNAYNSPAVAADPQDFAGIYCAGASWVISNNFIWECGSYGIFMDGRTTDLSITNGPWPSCTNYLIVNNLSWTNGIASLNMAGSGGVCLSNDFAFNTQLTAYCTNIVYGSLDGDGMYFFGFNQTIRSNYIHGMNYADPRNSPLPNPPHCDGIQTWGVAAGSKMGMTHDCVLDANIIDGTINGVMVMNGNDIFFEGASNVLVMNTVLRGHRGMACASGSTPCWNISVINNTFIGQTNDALASLSVALPLSAGKGTNLVWENNIAFNWTNVQFVPGNQFANLTSWKNLKFRDDGVPVSEDSTYAPWTANDFENVNPKLSNAYTNPPVPLLLSNSPAIDAGFIENAVTNDLLGIHRPVNNAWDIGAVEFNGTNKPAIVQQPISTNVYATQFAFFTVGATGTAPLSYQWKTNGVATGPNSPTLSLGPAPVAWSGMTVVCVVTNLAGSATSATATLTVSPDPVINTQPANATVGVGSVASFSVLASGQTTLQFQWSKNGSTIAGATASAYSTPATVAGDNNSHFAVVVTDSAGSLQSATATLTVTNIVSPPDPVITAQPQSTNIFATQSALFSITATGGSTLAYQWRTNSVNTGTNGPAFSIGPCPVTLSGLQVLCVVSDLAGSVTSSIATLTVGADPVITVQPQNVTVRTNQTATFTVTATGQTALTYQWSRNGVPIGGATSSSYTTGPLPIANNGDSYFVDVTDSAGTLRSANATLTVLLPPTSLARVTNLKVGIAHVGP